jgi:hypothetical protein
MALYKTDDNLVTVDGAPTGLYAAGYREIWRIDRDGDAYRIWEKIVPRIDDDVLDCTVYLYHSERDAIAGTKAGASGFLVGVPVGWGDSDWESQSRGRHIYAVTNSHVIQDEALVIRLNTREGETKVIKPSPESWIHHRKGDDIAITLIEPDPEVHKFKYIGVAYDMFVTEELLDKRGIGPGDETFAVGRFVARDERQSNAPIVRFGHISGLGTEMIDQGKERNNFKQESFLVESHSISGFSGSPVFVWVPLERTADITDPKLMSQFRKAVRSYQHRPREYFLGIDWGHLEDTHPPGMAGVVPAWKLLEVLSTPEVVEVRRAKEKNEAKITRGKLDIRSSQTRQSTRPKEGSPIEIPVPTEKTFFGDLKKVMRRKPPQSES